MGVKLFIEGRRACFTRPELNLERVSYDVPTPSAAIGMLEAIYWKPAIKWHVDRITVYRPIVREQWRTNEVSNKASTGRRHGIHASGNRVQRTTLALRDVAYLIEAHFTATDKAGPGDNAGKHLDTFNRRAANSQCWQHPCLGMREMMAKRWGQETDCAVDESLMGERDLGIMLHSIDHATGSPRFYRAIMCDGVINVPPLSSSEVMQ